MSVFHESRKETIPSKVEGCPFCGAGKTFIQSFSLNKVSDYNNVEDSQFFREIDVELGSNNEFHCSSCGKSWVVDTQGNEYMIKPGLETSRPFEPSSSNSDPSQQRERIDFKTFYTKYKDVDVLLAPDVPKENKILSFGSHFVFQNSPVQNEEAFSELKEARALRSGQNKLYNVMRRHVLLEKNGSVKPFVLLEPKDDSSIDVVKALDRIFLTEGRLVRLCRTSDDSSKFEQMTLNFLNDSEEEDVCFESFVEFLREKKLFEDSNRVEALGFIFEAKERKTNNIGFYRFEKTAFSVQMGLMDKFPGVKTERKENDGSNPGFPKEEYPWMLVLKSGANIDDVVKFHGMHFAKMKRSKDYVEAYNLSNRYYAHHSRY